MALKNVFTNSFALTSRLCHLPSAAAPAGQGPREHPAPQGSSRGCCAPSPCRPWYLCSQLSFVLAGNEKQGGVGSKALQGSAGCQHSLGMRARLHPSNLATEPCRSCPSTHVQASGSGSGQVFPPRELPAAPSAGCWVPLLPWGSLRAGPPAPDRDAWPLLGGSPAGLPLLRVFSHV